ncbi:hypothetical protein OPT61_g3272 [Boeremia exigua]|uniref:Uncharacterized protein n=1 Tax=Boeremia exigua TaxID=749465 RepID=A0ACC2IIH0_9PLEO|nr:hypothetical protein OPT61_g3272 [Boeremia exigua]
MIKVSAADALVPASRIDASVEMATAPPPSEISLLARLCIEGDVDNDDISSAFHSDLNAYLAPCNPPSDLWPVLLAAIDHCRPGIITLLFCQGLSILPLFLERAVEVGSKAVFKAFLDNGCDLNKPLRQFCPPVLGLFVHDHDMTMWFLDQEADPDARCYLDLTPLSFADRNASISTFRVLLDRGSVNKGQLVHHAVERRTDTVAVLDMLVAKGARLDELQYAKDSQSWDHESFKGLGTPLHVATQLGKIEVVSYLLNKQVNRDIRDSRNHTASDIAISMGYQDIANILAAN